MRCIFIAKTTLVDTFREMYRDKFAFEGNRSIVFDADDKIPVDELRHCISMALTYHLDKKSGQRRAATKRATR